MTAARKIFEHLGAKRFIVMTTATCYIENDGNTLLVKFGGSKVANLMYITINGMDTYDVRICKYRGLDVKTVKEVNGAYCEMLIPIFEQTTGLRTSL